MDPVSQVICARLHIALNIRPLGEPAQPESFAGDYNNPRNCCVHKTVGTRTHYSNNLSNSLLQIGVCIE